MQVQNNKEEVPFEHYAEKFRAIDPQAAAWRTGAAFDEAAGVFTLTLLGDVYRISWPEYAISSDNERAPALKSLPCQTFLLRFCWRGEGRSRTAPSRPSVKCRGARCISSRIRAAA